MPLLNDDEDVEMLLRQRLAEIRSNLDYGIPEKYMDEPHLTAWLYEQGAEYASSEHVGGWYADGGLERVREAVLNKASYKITEHIENRDRVILAFNRVTEGWPHRAKAMLAAHEFERGERDDEDYLEDCERFAGAEGMLDGFDYPEIETERFGVNPYRDGLTDEEATSVLVSRFFTLSDPTAEQLGRIEDHRNYQETVRDTGNIDTAIGRAVYDSILPDEVLGEVAPPDEWGSPDPTSVETISCSYCGSTFYRVVLTGGETAWVGSSGAQSDLTDLNSTEGQMWSVDDGEVYVCSECVSPIVSSTHFETVIIDAEGNHSTISVHGPMIIHEGGPEGHIHNSELGPEAMKIILSMAENGSNGGDDMLPVRTTDEYGESTSQQKVIEAIRTGELFASSLGPAAIVYSNMRPRGPFIVVPNSPKGIHRAKNFLEDASEYDPNSGSSTPGLGEMFG